MKEPFVAIDIIPTTPVLTLPSNVTAKHPVTGVLRISLSKPVKVKSIFITFLGKCVVNYNNETATPKTWLSKKTGDATNNHSLQIFDSPRTRNSMVIIKQTISLLEGGKKRELTKGDNEYPFSFDLPTDLPPSVTDSHGYVKYKLTAVVLPSSLLGKLAQEKVNYVLQIIRPRLMLNGSKRYSGMLEEKIKYDLEVPKMIVLSTNKTLDGTNTGEIVINARLTVMREIARIKTVSLEVSQTSKYLIISSNKVIERSFTTYTKPALLIDFTAALPSIMQDHYLTLALPFILISELSPDISSPYLEITHNFRITITFVNTSVSPCFLNPPVIVGYVLADKRMNRSASMSEGSVMTRQGIFKELCRRGSEGWVFSNQLQNGRPSSSSQDSSGSFDLVSRVSSLSSLTTLNTSVLSSVFEEKEGYAATEP
ncbi:9783_t:CDS:2 [Acaulospora colombiana]|uniref:9783_t:CDS:1 n=1 Tax=Acaulospora colombiana TaxID=27376 RepID=A0ACA9N5P7_9GLOM|nr:9783_t:CDS:2 [Acaulospora colombiana]